MTTWEYFITTDESRLPELGRDGWELISVRTTQDGVKLYLKRPRPSLRDQITLEQRDRMVKGEVR